MRNTPALDHYYHSLFSEPHPAFAMAKRFSEELHKDGISLSLKEAHLVRWLVEHTQCQRFVEIGTLTGYSALWILEGLRPKGKLWTFELSAEHAERAAKAFSERKRDAAFDKDVEIVLGDAEKKLSEVEPHGPFDGIFIDGNKAAYEFYLQWAEKHLRPGGVVIADNVFLGGNVYGDTDPRFSPKATESMKRFNQRLSDSKAFSSMLVPTAEGLFVAVKK